MVTHRGRRTKATLGATSSMSSAAAILDLSHNHDADWTAFMHGVLDTFAIATAQEDARLFTTNAPNLWQTYLRYLPAERQVHDCRTCKRFIENFGGLVTIERNGELRPALWNQMKVPEFYVESVLRMYETITVASRQVTGVFVHAHNTLGIYEDEHGWTHLHTRLPRKMVHTSVHKEPHQVVAEKQTDFETLARAMEEFNTSLLEKTCQILEAHAVSNAEKFVAPTRFLLELRRELDKTRNTSLRTNKIWRAVASAPIGWCSPRSGVIGSLLEDVADGKTAETVKRNFNKKVAPLAYQRPQAAPAAGTIQTAERLFDKLNLARSLERRFARLSDLGQDLIWHTRMVPRPKSRLAGTGVFSHLAPAVAAPQTVRAAGPITWVKFAEKVLPNAMRIEQNVPTSGSFLALTAPVHADAEPLLQWDDGTNPIAWYVIPEGSRAADWNLVPGWTKVNGVARLPSSRATPFISNGVVLLLDKAVHLHNAGLALFPQCIRSELHEVRSVIEAHSKSRRLSGRESASACGYDIRNTPDVPVNVHLRVLNDLGWIEYHIDRFE